MALIGLHPRVLDPERSGGGLIIEVVNALLRSRFLYVNSELVMCTLFSLKLDGVNYNPKERHCRGQEDQCSATKSNCIWQLYSCGVLLTPAFLFDGNMQQCRMNCGTRSCIAIEFSRTSGCLYSRL
jgi:hypothetical protein